MQIVKTWTVLIHVPAKMDILEMEQFAKVCLRGFLLWQERERKIYIFRYIYLYIYKER